jgi:hypothetical protein
MRAMMGGSLLVVGLATVSVPAAEAACFAATVNGRAMSAAECALAREAYGYVAPGHYLVDDQGNWVNLSNPAARGNLYLDARRGSGGGGGGEGLTRTPFGSVGGGYFFDNETGATVGP